MKAQQTLRVLLRGVEVAELRVPPALELQCSLNGDAQRRGVGA